MTPARIKAIRRWISAPFDAWVSDSADAERELQSELRRRGNLVLQCLDEIERLQSERDNLSAALDTIRDSVLHERFQLSEMEIGSEAVNAVLGIIDDHDPRPIANEDCGE